ncbi:zinc finger MYM-type protein 1-like isoform X2 [Hydractinia symbiolongicarpus]|uniref:zinc finger MYM-type protein 1-like isoform X2 n=1 Tax=Hydractinia symbiolongicarpus TaxID=13093 RepID=UPI00254C1D79|nr:zinc finger MYM-type protein 1-like isoform X2 [Hydractinia symbiolongicarpus]
MTRSEATGNCLYSSMSLLLVGDNTLVDELRHLTSLELFLHPEVYSKHPVLVSCYEKHQGKSFKSFNCILHMSMSFSATETGVTPIDFVRNEAVLNCTNQTWCSLLCMFALSTVTSKNIFSYFPDCGDERDKLLFNCKNEPMFTSLNDKVTDAHILFCLQGVHAECDQTFKANHFVPVLFLPNGTKRKLIQHSKKILPQSKKPCLFPKDGKVKSKLSFWTDQRSDKLILPTCKKKDLPQIKEEHKTVVDVSSMPPFAGSSKVNSDTVVCDSALSNAPDTTTSHPLCSSLNYPQTYFDVSDYTDKVFQIKDDPLKVHDLIQNVYKPDHSYKFPKTNRSFRFEWLTKFSWLCYSPKVDGAYCLPCVLFGHKFSSKLSKIKKLFSEPFKYWPDACANFVKHESSTGLHAYTSATFTSFMANYFGNSQPIDVLLDTNHQKKITENRKKLIPIVQAIIYSGRQGHALRGHRDDSQYHGELGEFSGGRVGNFVELLNFRVQGGDTALADHLKTCPKNATYISKTTQNELINCCGSVILDEIIQEVKSNTFFSILADEAADLSNKEQMSLVLRFVDSNLNIREEFVQYIHCDEGLAGKDLKSVLLKSLHNLTLNIKDCRGQAYDGAGAVAGYKNGLSAHILNLNKKAIYVHCNSHRLNLAVGKSCTISLVAHVMAKIKHISYFFNYSQKRQQSLMINIDKYSPTSKKTKLKDVCRTRWVERITGLDLFQELYVPIYITLEEMKLNLNRQFNYDTSKQAVGFFHQIANFEFLVTLVITRNVFDITLPVTQLLQNRTIDVMDSIELIQTLKNVLLQTRNNVEHFHDRWYEEAFSL